MSRKFSFPQLFISMSAKYFQLKARKAMEIFESWTNERLEKKCKSKSETHFLLYLIVVVSQFLIENIICISKYFRLRKDKLTSETAVEKLLLCLRLLY